MNNFFTPFIREIVHYDAKLRADGESWHFQIQKTGDCFNLKIETFKEGISDHLLSIDVRILLKFEVSIVQNGPFS